MQHQDLCRPEIKASLIARINRLHPDSKGLWGKMNVSQMMAHCQAQLRVALGDEKVKQSLIGMLFGKLAKKKVLEAKPFSKNLPTAPSFIIRNNPEFEDAKNKLIGLITRFNADALTSEPHPFFGKMTVEEWSAGTWKHLDHHLKQFGV
ncbi:MAG: hypothetical protein BWY67_01920 [Bacteroidetes bacterium ADurb.Bin397]|jgi:hypothetical protein|nr:MAG: hypothetical protein BWY67_01920 [Bacteroidetes bacterium ADurb.Bin397]